MAWFADLLDGIDKPQILDVGGTPRYWSAFLDQLPEGIRVTVLNIKAQVSEDPRIACVVGDARDLTQFGDGQFDICFSNSTIEHIGPPTDQASMASEIRRVGRLYFVQTPNARFPIEPHFLVPGWGLLPMGIRVSWLQRRKIGWIERTPTREAALALIQSVRLLTPKKLKTLFPDAEIRRERIGPFVKSLVAVRAQKTK